MSSGLDDSYKEQITYVTEGDVVGINVNRNTGLVTAEHRGSVDAVVIYPEDLKYK